MFKENSFINGLIVGFLLPIAAYVVLTALMQGLDSVMGNADDPMFSSGFRRRTFALVAFGLNAIPMNLAFKKKQTDTMRGIVIPTSIFIALWLWYFGGYIFAGM